MEKLILVVEGIFEMWVLTWLLLGSNKKGKS